jgi:NAD(P)H-hydrate epimerase
MFMEREVVTSREMRGLELNAEYLGVSQLQLMENAGAAVANVVRSRFRSLKTKVVVFSGLGDNGGDGFVAARHLSAIGYNVEVILAGRRSEISHDAAKKNWEALYRSQKNMTIHEVYDSSLIPEVNADVVIDALLGIGLKGEARPPVKQLIQRLNRLKAFRVSVDVPSGLDADSGKTFGEAVRADLTVTFHRAKPGLLRAKRFVGELIVAEIGLPPEFERFAGPGDVGLVSKPRPPEAHKGDFGRLLVVGGSEVYSGAPAYVALAALRTGVDITYVAAPEKTAYAISAYSPNLITVKLKGSHLNMANISTIEQYLSMVTGVAVGPGLGLHEETKEAVKTLIASVEKAGKPLLLDADGLKAFGEFRRQLRVPVVFTPHAGEYKALVGHFPPAELEAKVKDVLKSAQALGGVILLKGNVDVISDGKRVKQNFTGNPGMTVGGTGDVLSGIVGAFLAQSADSFEAAVAGAFVNGACGDFVKREKGCHMVATDLIDWIPRVLDDPMSHVQVRERG